MAKARVEQRVLLTADLDFGYLVAISEASLPSVVLFRLSDMRPNNLTTRLLGVLRQYGDDIAKGAFVVVGESSVRVRQLPIGNTTD